MLAARIALKLAYFDESSEVTTAASEENPAVPGRATGSEANAAESQASAPTGSLV